MIPCHSECASAFPCGSFCASASSYRCTENIRVVPIVIAELKLGNIERQILAADGVIGADDAAFQDRLEAPGE